MNFNIKTGSTCEQTTHHSHNISRSTSICETTRQNSHYLLTKANNYVKRSPFRVEVCSLGTLSWQTCQVRCISTFPYALTKKGYFFVLTISIFEMFNSFLQKLTVLINVLRNVRCIIINVSSVSSSSGKMSASFKIFVHLFIQLFVFPFPLLHTFETT